MVEIDVTYEEVCKWDESEYLWVDIRDEVSITYGGIPGAKWISANEIESRKKNKRKRTF